MTTSIPLLHRLLILRLRSDARMHLETFRRGKDTVDGHLRDAILALWDAAISEIGFAPSDKDAPRRALTHLELANRILSDQQWGPGSPVGEDPAIEEAIYILEKDIKESDIHHEGANTMTIQQWVSETPTTEWLADVATALGQVDESGEPKRMTFRDVLECVRCLRDEADRANAKLAKVSAWHASLGNRDFGCFSDFNTFSDGMRHAGFEVGVAMGMVRG